MFKIEIVVSSGISDCTHEALQITKPTWSPQVHIIFREKKRLYLHYWFLINNIF